MKIILAKHKHDTESCRRLQPRSVLGSFGVVLMSCKVNFYVVRSAWPHSQLSAWYIFDDQVFFRSYVLQHFRLRSFAVNVHLVFQMIFFPQNFFWGAMDSHSKREEFEIFNCNEKNVLLHFFSYTCHQFANHLKFFWKMETQNFYFKLLRTMSALFVQNFDSAHYAEVRKSQ